MKPAKASRSFAAQAHRSRSSGEEAICDMRHAGRHDALWAGRARHLCVILFVEHRVGSLCHARHVHDLLRVIMCFAPSFGGRAARCARNVCLPTWITGPCVARRVPHAAASSALAMASAFSKSSRYEFYATCGMRAGMMYYGRAGRGTCV